MRGEGDRAMRPQFKLQLLLRWGLTSCGRRIPLCLREQRVLALLAVRGALPRPRLAGTLWPDSTDSRALDSLRVSLHHIHRQAAGLVLCSDGWLEISEHTQIDYRQLAESLTHWSSVGQLHPGEVEQLLQAGELLPDWDDLWLLPEQQQWRALRAATLQHCAGCLLGTDRADCAVRLARQALVLDPLSERAASTLAFAEARQGHRAAAAAGLLAFIDRLQMDLGMNPGPEITHTLAQLRSG